MKNHGSVTAMAIKWEKVVRVKTNQARSQQVRSFKLVWLSNGSPHAIVINVLTKDLDLKEAPMKVHPEIVNTGWKTVADATAREPTSRLTKAPLH
jgi:hypothetical protein